MTQPDENPLLDIKILGRVTASVCGKPVDLAPKTRLVLVALVRNARITANDLNAWIDDRDPDRAQVAYEYVDELKRRLRAADPRAAELLPDNRDRKGYRLDRAASVTADVWRFQEL